MWTIQKRNGKYHWALLNRSGQELATSTEAHDSEDYAMRQLVGVVNLTSELAGGRRMTVSQELDFRAQTRRKEQ